MSTSITPDATIVGLHERQQAFLREAAHYRLAAAARRWRAERRLRRDARVFAATLRAALGPAERSELIALATRDRDEMSPSGWDRFSACSAASPAVSAARR